MATDFTGVAHVDLTVRDVDASSAWYQRVLGLRQIHRGRAETREVAVLVHAPTRLIVGLNGHDANDGRPFDETRTGLDHVGLRVGARQDLDDWARRFDELGVEHSPVADTPSGSALVFRDPDNIQFDLWYDERNS